MDKVLDLVDVFALGDTALQLLPIAIVVGGVIAVFIYGIKRSDSQQLQKTISKSVNAMKTQKPKKRAETAAKEVKSSGSSEQPKPKEKKVTAVVQQVKSKTVATAAKKSPAASKSSKAVVAKPVGKDKPKASASAKSPALAAQEAEGEWRTVTTKRQKKQTPEEGEGDAKKATAAQKKSDKSAKLPALAVAKGTVPKLEDVIAAMSSQNNFALFEQAEAESKRKPKTRALRE